MILLTTAHRATAQSAHPNFPDANGQVYALVISGNTLYVGGDFTMVGGQPRRGIAAIDLTTEQVTPWNPDIDGHVVQYIAASGTAIYFAGGFAHVGGVARQYLAAVDAASGLPLPWEPNVSRYPSALSASGDKVFIAVDEVTYVTIGAYDRVTGSTHWIVQSLNFAPTQRIEVISCVGERLFIAGRYRSLEPTNVGALDSETGAILNRYLELNSPSYVSMASNAGVCYVGGGSRLVAIDGSTGEILPWPGLDSGVAWSLAAAGSRVYLGGDQFVIDGVDRGDLVALDSHTAEFTGWAPTLGPPSTTWIRALAAAGGVVYVGGTFSSIGGESYSNLAAIDDATQLLDVPMPAPITASIRAVLPNPFGSTTLLRFDLPRNGSASLDLVDIAGRRMRPILDRSPLPAGRHELRLNRDGLAGGVYWVRLVVDGNAIARKIVILP